MAKAKKAANEDSKVPSENTKGRRKKSKEGGGIGHNLTEIRKKGEGIFKRLFTLQEEMDTQNGEFRVDFKNLYEEGANTVGCSRAVLRKEFRRMLTIQRLQEDDAGMAGEEKEETETLRAAMGDTPFGKYLETKLAA